MFKDYDKYLSTSLKVYILVLVIVFIMKIVGLDYFGLDVNNPTLVKVSDYIFSTHWGDVYNFITIYIQAYFMLCLSTSKIKLHKETFVFTVILFTTQCLLNMFYTMNGIYPIFSILILLIFPTFINKKILIKKPLIVVSLITLYQTISMIIRNVGINTNYNNFLIESILNLDQLLMLAITYNINFMKGGIKLCGVEVEALFSSQKLTNLKSLPKQLQRNWRKFKQQDKVDKITFIIYFALTLIWNIFTFVIVLLVARLNDTLIECIFIITSFWLSKRAFGKAFHLKSMIQCFIVSNITYYILNRITTPLGISILIPIMLGVGLSYVTSKLVKKTYKPLYRGMAKELFEETILQIVDKDSLKYKICYDFYINKKSDLSLSMKYNYSVVGIRKIKSRINDKIKEL